MIWDVTEGNLEIGNKLFGGERMKKFLLLIFLITSVSLFSQAIDDYKYQMGMAKTFLLHEKNDEAENYLILAYNNPKSPKKIKSEALYLLGKLFFEKGDYEIALKDWDELINDFPESEQAAKLMKELPELKQSIASGKTKKLSALEIANDFLRHNFSEKAKEKFLDIYHNPSSSKADKAQALYLLGQISFEQGNYSVALDDWEILIRKFPNSKQTLEIAQKLSQLRDVITQSSDTSVISVIAKSYLQNGDFWSNAKNRFDIDSSWLPSVEMANYWYDKIIKEFPKSKAAEIAYRRKLFTLMGWKEPGKYGEKYGLKRNFKKYINQVLDTFYQYEKKFPNSSYLQGFRYQIAQAYWMRKDWKNAKVWLNKVIQKGNGKDTFYTQTAKERLKFLKF